MPIALSPGHHARAFACRRASDFPRGAKAFLDQKLFAAIGQRDLVSVDNLIREGASVEARGTNGMTPLMEAAEQGSVPLLSLLLENGAKPNAKDEQGETALSWAARGGWVRAVDLLGGLSDEAAKKTCSI